MLAAGAAPARFRSRVGFRRSGASRELLRSTLRAIALGTEAPAGIPRRQNGVAVPQVEAVARTIPLPVCKTGSVVAWTACR
jgi:hypothetical protein